MLIVIDEDSKILLNSIELLMPLISLFVIAVKSRLLTINRMLGIAKICLFSVLIAGNIS